MLAEVARAMPGVEFLFVNQGEGRDTIKRYLAAEVLDLPNILLDRHGFVPRHYGAMGIPVTLFIDRSGRLKTMHIGEVSREMLNDYIEDLAEQS